MKYLKIIPILSLFLIIISCKEKKKEQNNDTSISEEKTEIKKDPKFDSASKLVLNVSDFSGTWSTEDNYPMVGLSIENDTITVRECYGIDAEKGTTYQAKYSDGKIIALGNEKDFYKWTLPTFEFTEKNTDTIVFNSGVGSVKLTKTKVEMPNITYSKPKNND